MSWRCDNGIVESSEIVGSSGVVGRSEASVDPKPGGMQSFPPRDLSSVRADVFTY